jgi:hypothetical protein
MFLKRVLMAAGAVAAAMALAAVPAPAGADTGLLWLGDAHDMGGKTCGWAGSQSNISGTTFCTFGDKASSAKNSSDDAWVLYDDKNFKDTHFCLVPGERNDNLDNQDFGNKISSIKRLDGASCAGYPRF